MKVCKKCGIEKAYSEFHKSKDKRDGLYPDCKICSRIKAVKRYAKNRENEISKRKEYYENHKEEVKEKSRLYYYDHKQRAYEYNIDWRKKNPEKLAKSGSNYRKRTKAKQTAKTRKRQALVLQRLPKCANLQEIEKFYIEARRITNETGIKHEVDHIIPLQGKLVSGFHVEWNLQILTKSQNSSKGRKF